MSEHFTIEPAAGNHPGPIITIVVNDKKYEVHPGKWVVRDLKAATGVDPTMVLAEITPNGLKDLEDNATVEVHQGERFMSHVSSGASS